MQILNRELTGLWDLVWNLWKQYFKRKIFIKGKVAFNY